MSHRKYDFVRRHFIDPAPRWRDQRNPVPAVFLDRDGVVNEEVHYLSKIDDLALIPGTASAIKQLNDAGIPVVIVTNQSAVARGYLSEEGLRDLHEAMIAMLSRAGASVQGIYYSPYHPDGIEEYRRDSECRKPGPAMILAAAEDFAISLPDSVLIGDRINDIRAGRAAGTHAVIVRTGHGAKETTWLEAAEADFIADDLQAAVSELFARGVLAR
ncbi:D-glycero-alpha-D-manno-heptose-1,7-bisphosphate 7-phosphatase [Thalassospira xiamenensis]|jgi:D-glycero-D-manno-heptose 1,7-bisphosphate phosphatase|uniref:D,D-heptose 1,7-bisphosphate phosphatase n=1 Tax=Thalassospira xiamenensis TaxID=220697 RepID=A0A367WXH4_9PROT|nr:HAD family hydrolase [Thalassospira xiamenensis]KZB53753.1 D,D-heptose 1,7-bisphosphate phosphatase [Thalassospira xiamenensis]RCK45929.1 D,D-heptose 1,7-bisphosphate phosphatase [Thalassospira xiamenensis]